MIYHLYLTVVLLTGQVQYDAVGPSGPDLAGCVRFAQYAITKRGARGAATRFSANCDHIQVTKSPGWAFLYT